MELLNLVALFIGKSVDDFTYIQQKFDNAPIGIADFLQGLCFEWAWKNKDRFESSYFSEKHDKSIFFKHICAEIISSQQANAITDKFKEELAFLKQTNPHAIITTNYDNFLEILFDGYEPVIGDKVIKYNLNLVGEIFKIHGSIEKPESIVINSEDYKSYRIRKKYISAKLLTYLAEHPVFIFGYGFGDPNVTEILQDVGEIIGNHGFIDNIFYVNWSNDIKSLKTLSEEHVFGLDSLEYRVRSISTDDFTWVFKAIAQERYLQPVNTKILRALAARTYKLIRNDIPRHKVEVDYKNLESLINNDDELPKLLGIISSNNSNMTHPFTLTQIGRRLDFPGWHGARALIEKINKEKGINICASDNPYHCKVKTGDKSSTGKYSKETIKLLENVKDGKEYALDLL